MRCVNRKFGISALLVMMLCILSACGNQTEKAGEAESVVSTAQTGGGLSDLEESGENASNTKEKETATDTAENAKENQIQITAGDTVFMATLADNSSAKALKELLADGPLTIDMSDYGDMEKVGSIGKSLPTNDEEITTEAGDLILYQGNSLVIYYDINSWNFTRLGKIEDVTGEELLKAFGKGDVTVTFSLCS